MDLRLRVWGMGSNNQPFHQNAIAQNVSATGACIHGLEQLLKVGDVVGVQYETKKARCRIIWVIEAGGLKKIQVGVQLVADQECPWLAQLPIEAKAEERDATPDNRRRYHRHKIAYPLEFRDERVDMPMRVNATDISGNGCYVETVMPLTMGTILRVDLWLEDERITTSAAVRTRDPGVGMGIEFTSLTEEMKKRFQDYLDQANPTLASDRPPTEEANPTGADAKDAAK